LLLSQTIYNIKKNNGQTINIGNDNCKIIFQSSNASHTGTYYQYNVGENYSITFYSGSQNKRLKITFGDVNGIGNFTYNSQTGEGSLYILAKDYLYIYDGPNTSSPLMHKYTGTEGYSGLGLYQIYSSSSYLTFRFTSANTNTSNIFLGWSALITCENKPIKPVGTAENPPAENFCYSAPEICNLDGYYGNTSDYYTSDLPGNMCEMCDLFNGTIQNNSWVTFTADSTHTILEIKVGSCAKGIQLGIYSGEDCNNFKLISDIAYTTGNLSYYNAGKTLTLQLPYKNLPKLIPGKTYYIMIDGLAGDVCDYTIKAKKGVTLKVTAGSDKTICLGESVQLNATGGNSYRWAPVESLNNPNIANPIASPTITTTYSVTATGGINPNCPLSDTDELIVYVEGCGCEPPALSLKVNNYVTGYTYCSRGGGGESLPLNLEIEGGSNCKTKWVYSWFNGSKYFDGSGFNSSIELWSTDYKNARAIAKLGINTLTASVKCDGLNTCKTSASISVVVMTSKGLNARIFQPENGINHSLFVNWQVVTGADGYILEYSEDLINWYSLYEGQKPYYHHIVGDNPNKAYHYRMQVFKGQLKCDWSSLSNPAYTACDFPELIINNSGENSLELFLSDEQPKPNPPYTTYSIFSITLNKYLHPDGSFNLRDTFLTKADWGIIKLTNLEPDKQYCFYALAKNNNGIIHTEAYENQSCSFVTNICNKPIIKDTANTYIKNKGEDLILFADVYGTSPFNFEWKKDSLLLKDSINNKLIIKSIEEKDTGNYYCIISNKCDTIQFLIATIKISSVPALTGKIIYDNKHKTPVNYSQIILKNIQGIKLDSTINDNLGFFQFNNLGTANYTIELSTEKPFKGSDPLDALIINRYYLGKYSFTNSLRQKAADVNSDNKINLIDALMINRRYIGVLTKFISPDWLFEYTPNINIDNKTVNLPITAICYGDVNGSYPSSNKKNHSSLHYEKDIIKLTDTIYCNNNEIINIPLSLNKPIELGAFGLILEFNNNILSIIEIKSNIENLLYNITDNKILIAYSAIDKALKLNTDEVIINIKALINNITPAIILREYLPKSGNSAKFDNYYFKILNYTAYNYELIEHNKTFLKTPALKSQSLNYNQLSTVQNFPENLINWHIDYTNNTLNIEFLSSQYQEIILEIFDIQSRLVYKRSFKSIIGKNNYNISLTEINSSKLLSSFYVSKLTSNKSVFINKLFFSK